MESTKESVPVGAARFFVQNEENATYSLLEKIYRCVPSLQESDDPELVMLPDHEDLTAYAHRRLRGESFALTDGEFTHLSRTEFGYGLDTYLVKQQLTTVQ